MSKRKDTNKTGNQADEVKTKPLGDEELNETQSQVDEAELDQEQEQAEATSLEEEADLLKIQMTDLEDKHLRLSAEFDNFRKRSRKEQEATYQRAKMDLVRDFLPLMDALDRARESYDKIESRSKDSLIEGMDLLIKQAQDCLARVGVEEIPAMGQVFDPELHEAVQHIEDEELGENEIALVLLKGYKASDQVIRHSVVVVAN